ncbi:hypothetical protein OQA88_6998 [Cercophora sp. LCS_1]
MAGIGMVMAYAIQVILATAFLLAPAIYYGRHPKHAADQFVSLLGLVAAVFLHTIRTAAMVVIRTDGSMYQWWLARRSSGITASTTLATWPLYAPMCRFQRSRIFGFWMVSVMHLAVGLETSDTVTPVRQLFTDEALYDVWRGFESYCLYRSSKVLTDGWDNALLSTATVAGLAVLVIAGQATVALKRWKKRFLVASCLTWISVAWFQLASVIILRSDVGSLASPTLVEGDWSFGQILSLATTMIDFVVVWGYQVKGLEYRLPLGIGIQRFRGVRGRVGEGFLSRQATATMDKLRPPSLFDVQGVSLRSPAVTLNRFWEKEK